MNVLATDKRVQVLAALVEGNSIRSTVRMTGVAKNTVTNLLVDVGRACGDYHDEVMHDLPCKRIQVDEVWSFCYAKAKNVPKGKRGRFGYGDECTLDSPDFCLDIGEHLRMCGADSETIRARTPPRKDRPRI